MKFKYKKCIFYLENDIEIGGTYGGTKDSQDAYMEKLQDIKVRVPKEYYESTLTKLKMCSGASMEEIEQKLQEYKDIHNGKLI